MKESDVQKLAITKLESEGYSYWFPKRTWGERDIFGVFDFIAMRAGKIMLVQLTTIQHLSDRRTKIKKFYESQRIQMFPANVYIWAWDKRVDAFKIAKVFN